MKRVVLLGLLVANSLAFTPLAGAEEGTYDDTHGSAETVDNGVHVVIDKDGRDAASPAAPGGGGGGSTSNCSYSSVDYEGNDAIGLPAGRYVTETCAGEVKRIYRVDPTTGGVAPAPVDLGAVARTEAGRYVEEVVVPAVRIGVNPAAQGLVGLSSWFWIEGWAGSTQAAPISAYGVTIDVRMTSGTVTWDFGDGTVVVGDLGRPYPLESSVRHVHQDPGTFTIHASISLTPEYRIDGGPWTTLPPLSMESSLDHPVQERQAVITQR